MEVRSHLNKSLFECYQIPLHVIPETRKKQMCLRGVGNWLVGVKKGVGGGPGEVKKEEELGREGKGWRRSFSIFPFTLFSSPPSHFCAHHTGYEVAAESLIPCPFPTRNLKDRSERGEWLQTIEEWDMKGKERTAGEAAILLTFYIPPPFLTWVRGCWPCRPTNYPIYYMTSRKRF